MNLVAMISNINPSSNWTSSKGLVVLYERQMEGEVTCEDLAHAPLDLCKHIANVDVAILIKIGHENAVVSRGLRPPIIIGGNIKRVKLGSSPPFEQKRGLRAHRT
jgi:hypothetical protein